MTYDFPTAFSSWRYGDGGPESAAIERVLRSNRLTMGQETEAFEAEIAAYHNRRHAIAVNSGSSANLVSVAVAKSSRPKIDSAIAPAIAWATSYSPLFQCGIENLTIADVDDSWNASAGKKIYLHSLIFAVPVLGNTANMIQWSICSGFSILIEDACESLGARDEYGYLAGTLSDLSTGSGFYSHQLSAIELGWILTDDDELAQLCRLLRNHGNDGWGSEDFEAAYNFTIFGYNLRPAEINAAVAREQLKRLDEFVEQRRANLTHFTAATAGLPITLPRMVGKPSPFGLAFTCESKESRARLVKALRTASIDCRPPTGGSFTRHPYGAPWRDQPTPNADRIHDTGMFLGNAPFLIPALIDRAVKIMRAVL